MQRHLRFFRCSLHTWRTQGPLPASGRTQAKFQREETLGKIPTQADPATTSEQWRRSGGFCWPLVNVCPPKSHSTPHLRVSKVGLIPAPPSRRANPVPSSASQAAEQGPLLPPCVRSEPRRVPERPAQCSTPPASTRLEQEKRP